jgi:iron complex outermembrane recepter protein
MSCGVKNTPRGGASLLCAVQGRAATLVGGSSGRRDLPNFAYNLVLIIGGETNLSTKPRFALRPLLALSVSLATLSFASAAHAQSESPTRVAAAGGAADLEEITVTARKRQESILNVPVIEQALPQEKLERLQVTEMTDLPKIVPGLNLGHSLLSIGTLVSIRGVGTASQDPGVDQSISLNIDGLSLGNGLAFSSGLFDLGQIEVLKGPQALFYGKSSPGGVISMRTADPTDQFEVIGRGAYEFEAVNPRGELIVSGPVNETLKLRLAAMYSTSNGYFDNVATALPNTGAVTPYDKHAPDSKKYQIRGTALWNPFSQLTARLKVNFVHERAISAESFQCTNAPTGTTVPPIGAAVLQSIYGRPWPPFQGGGEDCRMDRTQRLVFLDPANFPAALNNGVPFLETNQAYGTFELNYSPADVLTLTSVTAYYNLSSSSLVNPYQTTYSGPLLGVNNHFHRREATEEVRANSDFKGPLNFSFGALYEDGQLTDNVTVFGNTALLPPLVPACTSPFLPQCILQNGNTPVDIKTYSVFGQLRWTLVERLELAAGVRWTDEKRTESPVNMLTGKPTTVPTPELHAKNYSPEITLTYRPTDDLTLFGAWKRGFKSGSFSVATPVVGGIVDNSFGDERVQGGELGLKSRWLDRQLAVNVAGYYYNYYGLQVGVISQPQGGVPIIQTLNAATARTYGIDFDAAFRPQAIRGLGLNASVNWNHGRFLKFTNAPCWGGQLFSEGCNQTPAAQDLSGTPLVRAPAWQANLGFDYEVPVKGDYTLVFSNSTEISSRFVTYPAANRPNNDNYQSAFAKVDLSLALRAPGERWELAVIGKDINDKITSGNCVSSPLLTETVPNSSGGTTRSIFGIDPAGCFVDPGREVWLRLTVRPFAGRH